MKPRIKFQNFRTLLVLGFSLMGLSAAGPSLAAEAFLPLIIEDVPTEEVRVDIIENGEARLDSTTVLRLLSGAVENETLQKLTTLSATSSDLAFRWIKLSSFKLVGVQAELDSQKLEIRITIPPSLKRKNVVSLTRSEAQLDASLPNSGITRPSAVSAFVNANAAQAFDYGTEKQRRPFQTLLDGALQVHSLVLEGSGSYTEPQIKAPKARPWKRGDVRLVKDLSSAPVRLSAGDLSYPAPGYSRFRAMGGVGATSVFSIQPYETFYALGQTEIFLKTPSKVRVFLNRQLLQVLELPAGSHDLRDFPFSSGISQITLEITDSFGRVERLELPTVGSDQTLRPGIHQFSYALGSPSFDDPNRGRIYDGTHPTISASHRFGFSKSFTPGAFFQAEPDQWVAGPTAALASAFGNFTLDPAVSSTSSNIGWAGRLTYLIADYLGPQNSQRSLNFSFETKGPRFASLGETSNQPFTRHDFATSLSFIAPFKLGLSLSSSVRWIPARLERKLDSRTFSAGLSKNWTAGLDTSLLLTNTKDITNDQSRNSIFFLLTWVLPNPAHTVSGLYQSETQSLRGQYNYSPSSLNQIGGFSANAGAETNELEKRADLQLDYSTNRSSWGLTHESQDPKNGLRQHQTGITFGTSLVFSGTQFGLSRRVNDSFALVGVQKDLSGQNITLNPVDEDAAARTDFLGPAVLPDLVSYRRSELQIGTSELTFDHAPIAEFYRLRPTYKSGTEVLLGSDPTVIIRARLTDNRDIPFRLWSATLAIPNSPTQERVVFTNREGEMVIENLAPGQSYILRPIETTSQNEAVEFHFTIPSEKSGILDLGTLHPGLNPKTEKKNPKENI